MNSLFFKLSLILASVDIPTAFTLIKENPILWVLIFNAFIGLSILTVWMVSYYLKTIALVTKEKVSISLILWSSIGCCTTLLCLTRLVAEAIVLLIF